MHTVIRKNNSEKWPGELKQDDATLFPSVCDEGHCLFSFLSRLYMKILIRVEVRQNFAARVGIFMEYGGAYDFFFFFFATDRASYETNKREYGGDSSS